MAYRNYAPANGFIVDSSGNGDFTTIQAAITAASSGQTIFIKDGTYTENPNLKAGVDLAAFLADAYEPNVIIKGTCTFTGAGTVSMSGIELQTNSSYALTVSGSAASTVNLISCNINCLNNTGINFSSSSASSGIYITSCIGNIGTTGIGIYTKSSAGQMEIYYSQITNTGNSVTASSNSAGIVYTFNSIFYSPLSTSSTGTLIFQYSIIENNGNNAVGITTAGSSSSNIITQSTINSGTSSAISIGTGTTILAEDLVISSSNTNAITGAGTIEYGLITYSGSSSTNNVTTQTSLPSELGSLALNTALTVSNGGTGVKTLTGLALGSGTGVLTGVSYTPVTSWTPNIQINGSSTGITYTTQLGTYQVIGNMVYISFSIALSNKGSSTGSVTISNLPVSAGSISYLVDIIPICSFSGWTLANYTTMGMFFNNTSTVGNFIVSGSGQADGDVTNSTITNTFTVNGSGFYFTN